MGNKVQKSGDKLLEIELDCPSYFCGEEVGGIVRLDLKQPMNWYKLTLHIDGTEKVTWTIIQKEYKDPVDKTIHIDYEEEFKEQLDFTNIKYTIHEFGDEEVEPGVLEFPFKFEVSERWPSSSFFSGPNKSIASIEYIVKAVLSWDNEDISVQWVLLVQEKPKIPKITQQLSENSTTSLCLWTSSKHWLISHLILNRKPKLHFERRLRPKYRAAEQIPRFPLHL